MFTFNNPPGLILESDFKSWGARYLCYQEEVGLEGTHHFQGYIETFTPVRWSHFKGLEGAHFEPAIASVNKNNEYCSKLGDVGRVGGPYVYGKPSSGPGMRDGILAIRDAIRDGKRGRELADDDTLVGPYFKYQRGVDALVRDYTPSIDRTNVVVTFHYGPSGTGKSHCCFTPDAYFLDANNGFWNGYDGQSKVILDEFGGHVMSPLQLQRLCDKYPYECNTKGLGRNPCNATDIHITSNYLPSHWWSEKTRYNSRAIYRRITVVHYHDKYKHYVKFEHDDPVEGPYAMDKLLNYISDHPLVITSIQ